MNRGAATAPVEPGTPLPTVWEIRGGRLALDHPRLMGIVNVTPDSFSDGGQFDTTDAATRHALALVDAGADLLDVGGESTRPGAVEVPEADELRRVLPVIERLVAEAGVPISVDTRKAAVARAAVAAGAAIVNDVSALADPEMAATLADTGAGAVLMHMRGTPATMNQLARYRDVGREVADELRAALRRAKEAGIPVARVALDPGLGFAKRTEHNLQLLRDLSPVLALGRPLVVGPSRKRFLGAVLEGAEPAGRDVATAAACVVGFAAGARVFRVHDVATARQALAVAAAVQAAGAS